MKKIVSKNGNTESDLPTGKLKMNNAAFVKGK